MSDFKAAVIGLGHGQAHADAYARLPNAELLAVCDLDERKLEEARQRWNVPLATMRVEEIIEHPEINVVSICTFDHLHYDHAVPLIEAGKHLMIEKPMTTRLDHAIDLVRLASKHGVTVGVGNVNRFEPHFANIHKLVSEGRLGELFMVESDYIHDMRAYYTSTWRNDPKAPQDFWLGGPVHAMDMARWLAGDVEEVFMYSRGGVYSKEQFPLDSEFICALKFKSGALGKIMGSAGIRQRPEHYVYTRAMGTKGTAYARSDDRNLYAYLPEEFEDQAAFTLIPTGAGRGHPTFEEIREFLHCIENNLPPRTDVIDGAKTVAALTAALESARTGQPVKVKNEFL